MVGISKPKKAKKVTYSAAKALSRLEGLCHVPEDSQQLPGQQPHPLSRTHGCDLRVRPQVILLLVAEFISPKKCIHCQFFNIIPKKCKVYAFSHSVLPTMVVAVGRSQHGGWVPDAHHGPHPPWAREPSNSLKAFLGHVYVKALLVQHPGELKANSWKLEGFLCPKTGSKYIQYISV